MSKDPIPLTTPDISRFAKSLTQQLQSNSDPSHLTVLNMVARAAGFRNYQHLRAANAAQNRLARDLSDHAPDFRLVEKALNQFDAQGRLIRWPSRRAVQDICLWALWSRIPTGQKLNERQLSARLNDLHLFQDAAILRRSLVCMGLMTRNSDGSEYQRIEQRPPPEAVEIIQRLKPIE